MNRSTLTRRMALFAAILAIPVLLIGAVLVAGQRNADASSHREAPMISKDQFADNTDTYVFLAPENQDNLVLVASWIPFEGPEGGPNYYEWDDNVLYDIYVDIDGDATAEVTYTLKSQVQVNNGNTFLYNTGTIGSIGDGAWNRYQTYTVTEYFEPGVQPSDGNRAIDAHIQNLVSNVRTAPVNIGNKSTPGYAALEAEATYEVTDKGDPIKIFAGQTDDPFFVDLQVFDLLTLRGEDPPIGYQTDNIPVDSLSGFNVHSLVIEVPVSRLVRDGETVLGVWSGSRRQTMNVDGSGTGEYKQVSRLGMPLVNEVVMPMALKDIFNTLRPEQDLSVYNLLQERVENPEVGTLLCSIYAGSVPLPEDNDNDCNTEFDSVSGGLENAGSGRGDIFQIFLTGMELKNDFTVQTANGATVLPAGTNVNQPANVQPAEMIRINTALKGDICKPEPSPLGVLGGDACGFPNGRRLADDVTDIAILAVAGAAYEVLDDEDASFTFNGGLLDVLRDNVDRNDVAFRNSFPYVGLAQSGQSHLHQNPLFGYFAPFLSSVASAAGAVSANPVAGSASLALVSVVGAAAFIWRRRR